MTDVFSRGWRSTILKLENKKAAPKRIARSAIFLQSKSVCYTYSNRNNESWAKLLKCDYKFCFVWKFTHGTPFGRLLRSDVLKPSPTWVENSIHLNKSLLLFSAFHFCRTYSHIIHMAAAAAVVAKKTCNFFLPLILYIYHLKENGIAYHFVG